MTTADRCLLHLSLINGVGDSTIAQIVRRCEVDNRSLHELYSLSAITIAHYFHLPIARAQIMVDGLSDGRLLDCELTLLERSGVGFITMLDENYPRYLKAIHAPPPVLYWQGQPLSAEAFCMAVIGSRRVNYYGLSAIETLVPPLVHTGWIIISGGAIGADSKAHEVALDAGGRTIAILGSGLLRPYPASNKKLFNRMLAHGSTIVSPFPLEMEGFPANFPARNRIIAGMSYGCLVVQAAAASGTHITAQCALEEGRELFAVPGSINDPLSIGCHTLIQQGAKLVQEPKDMLSELQMKPAGCPPVAALRSREQDEDLSLKGLVGPEAAIVAACKFPCSIDELSEHTSIAVQELYSLLFMLEVKGLLIRQLNGTWTCRK